MAIKDNTAGVLQEVDRRIAAALEDVAPKVTKTAKDVVVVVTGKLQRSITEKIDKRKAVIGSPLVYAPMVEINKPYLRVALETNKENIRRAFKI